MGCFVFMYSVYVDYVNKLWIYDHYIQMLGMIVSYL